MPGIAVDEMQHPVMGAPEAELGQHLVRLAHEIAVGKEQQLDQVPDSARPRAPPGRRSWAADRQRGAVRSAILTYFGWFVTHGSTACESALRACRNVPSARCIAPVAQAGSHGTVETYGCRLPTQKRTNRR